MLLTRLLKKFSSPKAAPSPQPATGVHLSERLLRGPRVLVLIEHGEISSLPLSYLGWVQLTLDVASFQPRDIAARVRGAAGELPVLMDSVHSTLRLSVDESNEAASMLGAFRDILAPNGFIHIQATSHDRDSMTAVLTGAGFPFSRVQLAPDGQGAHVLAFRAQPTPDQRARYQLRPRSVRPADCRV
jgi:hypothetical protein